MGNWPLIHYNHGSFLEWRADFTMALFGLTGWMLDFESVCYAFHNLHQIHLRDRHLRLYLI